MLRIRADDLAVGDDGSPVTQVPVIPPRVTDDQRDAEGPRGKVLHGLLASGDEYKLKSVTEILGQKLVKRGVPLKGLQYGTITPASHGRVRQEITLQQGISTEKAKEIIKVIKDSKLKVQASIQSDMVRVSGKDRDTLQQVIALLRGKDFGIELQFTNYRSN